MSRHRSTRSWHVMGESFDLTTRFKVIDYLGSGAYGTVCAVQDYQANEVVAIKKCKKIFQSRTLAKRTLREMRLLRHINHENIVKLKFILPPVDAKYYVDLYLVFEIMDTDLAQIIRSPQALKEQHTQYFIFQLLRALEYLHSKNIVHRDIKPRNILVNADCTLKVADFGLARLYRNDGPESVTAITDYVTTRWYRAPEVIVGWSSYTAAIDMWAVGCIMAELLTRSPLFPGENTMKQLGLILRAMGSPSDEFIMRSTKAMFRQYMLGYLHRTPLDLNLLLPHTSPDAVDMIRRLLEFDPSRRLSAPAALAHPFIARMSAAPSPPVCSPMCIAPEEFDYETRKLTIDDLRAEVAYEIDYYNLPKDAATPGHLPVGTASESSGHAGVEDKDKHADEAAGGALLPPRGAVGRDELIGTDEAKAEAESEAQFVAAAAPHQPPPIRDPDFPKVTTAGGERERVAEAMESAYPSQPPRVQAAAPAITPAPTRAAHTTGDAAGDALVTAVAPCPRPGPSQAPALGAEMEKEIEKDLGAVLEGMEALLREGAAEGDDTSSQATWRDAPQSGEANDGKDRTGPSSLPRGGSSTVRSEPGPGLGAARSTASLPAFSPGRGPAAVRVAAELPPARRSPLQHLPPRYISHPPPTSASGQARDIECGAPTVRAYEQLRRRNVDSGISTVAAGKVSASYTAQEPERRPSYAACCRDDPWEPSYDDLRLGDAVVARQGRASTDEEEGKVGIDALDGYETVDRGCGWASPQGPAVRQGHGGRRNAVGRRGADKKGVWDQLASSCTVS